MIWPLSKKIFKRIRRRDLWPVSGTTIPQILRIYTERNGWYAPQENNLWKNSFSWCLISTHLKTTTPSITTLSSSWLDQPIWKMFSSEWIIISPTLQGEYLINHHLEMLHSFFGWILPNFGISHWIFWSSSYFLIFNMPPKTSNHLQPPLVPRQTATGYPQGTPVFGGHPLPAMLKELSQATLGWGLDNGHPSLKKN